MRAKAMEGFQHMLSLTFFRETLTSQNSPSSYNASSLKGSKNGRLTIIPKETNHTSSLNPSKSKFP